MVNKEHFPNSLEAIQAFNQELLEFAIKNPSKTRKINRKIRQAIDREISTDNHLPDFTIQELPDYLSNATKVSSPSERFYLRKRSFNILSIPFTREVNVWTALVRAKKYWLQENLKEKSRLTTSPIDSTESLPEPCDEVELEISETYHRKMVDCIYSISRDHPQSTSPLSMAAIAKTAAQTCGLESYIITGKAYDKFMIMDSAWVVINCKQGEQEYKFAIYPHLDQVVDITSRPKSEKEELSEYKQARKRTLISLLTQNNDESFNDALLAQLWRINPVSVMEKQVKTDPHKLIGKTIITEAAVDLEIELDKNSVASPTYLPHSSTITCSEKGTELKIEIDKEKWHDHLTAAKIIANKNKDKKTAASEIIQYSSSIYTDKTSLEAICFTKVLLQTAGIESFLKFGGPALCLDQNYMLEIRLSFDKKKEHTSTGLYDPSTSDQLMPYLSESTRTSQLPFKISSNSEKSDTNHELTNELHLPYDYFKEEEKESSLLSWNRIKKGIYVLMVALQGMGTAYGLFYFATSPTVYTPVTPAPHSITTEFGTLNFVDQKFIGLTVGKDKKLKLYNSGCFTEDETRYLQDNWEKVFKDRKIDSIEQMSELQKAELISRCNKMESYNNECKLFYHLAIQQLREKDKKKSE